MLILARRVVWPGEVPGLPGTTRQGCPASPSRSRSASRRAALGIPSRTATGSRDSILWARSRNSRSRGMARSVRR